MSEEKKKPNLRLPVEHYTANKTDIPVAAPGKRFDETAANSKLLEKIKENPNKKPMPEDRLTLESIKRAASGVWSEGEYDSVLDGELDQESEIDGTSLRNRVRETKTNVDENGKANNSSFLRGIRSSIGTGKHAEVLCWHSGFTMTFGDITAEAVFRLTGRLQELRDNIGTNTNGMIFTTDDGHTTTAIIDFLLDHVIECNIKGWTRDIIEANLRMCDAPWVMAMGLHSMYPNGYPLQQECSNLDEEGVPCGYSTLTAVERVKDIAKINFLRACVKKSTSFTRTQKRHMAKSSVTVEEVTAYQDTLLDQHNLNNKLGPVNNTGSSSYYLIARDPNYKRYKSEVREWFAEVTAVIEEVMAGYNDISPAERAAIRKDKFATYTSSLRGQKVGPWIDAIVEERDGEVTRADDRTIVFESLGALSEKDSTRDNIEKCVLDFQNKSFHSFVGLSNFTCPGCKSAQKDIDPASNLIPIQVSQYFFTMLVLRPVQKN